MLLQQSCYRTPTTAPSFLSKLLFCSNPTTHIRVTLPILLGRMRVTGTCCSKKKVRLSVFPPPHTFALQLCAGPLPCCALFVSGREGWGMQRSSWELTHWPWLLGFSACYCCNLQFQIARSKALLKDSLQPSPYPYSFSFKLYVARCAMEISTTTEAAEGLCSDVKRNGVQKAGLEMGALGLQCSALPSKL